MVPFPTAPITMGDKIGVEKERCTPACIPKNVDGIVASSVPSTTMTMLKPCDAVWAGELESFTCTVIGNVPDCVGVPAINPDEAVSVTPVGKEPDVIDHV